MERGRENESFPAVEVLKPQGFKEERSDDEMVSFPLEESIENRGFSKSEASEMSPPRHPVKFASLITGRSMKK